MKKRMLKQSFCFLIAGLIIFSCAIEMELENSGKTLPAQKRDLDSVLSYNEAFDVALAKISQVAKEDENWQNAEIVQDYYWYNPIVEDGPAYIEYKLEKDGVNKGSIFVSLTELDYQTPQYHTEGISYYEELVLEADGDAICEPVRYDPFNFEAKKVSTRAGGGEKVFARNLKRFSGLIQTRAGGNDYDKHIQSYLDYRRDKGTIVSSRDRLKRYYDLKKGRVASRSSGPNWSRTASGVITDLNLLPCYAQFDVRPMVSADYWSGCTPTAFAMIFGYWYHKHGYTGLFNSDPSIRNSMNDSVHNIVYDLREYMGTSNPSSGGGGSTAPKDGRDGAEDYAEAKGYSVDADYWRKIDPESDSFYSETIQNNYGRLLNDLQHNWPAKLGLEWPGGGGHSVVIYKCQITRDTFNGDVEYADISILNGYYLTWSLSSETLHSNFEDLWNFVLIEPN